MGSKRVLLVEDDAMARRAVAAFLSGHGFDVEEVNCCAAAEEAFRERPPDAAVLDYSLPDGNALELLPRIRELTDVPIVILTGHGTIGLAVQAMQRGADHFLTKPVELAALQVVLERLMDAQRSRKLQAANLSRQGRRAVDPFMGGAAAIRALAEEAHAVALVDAPVLIQGETGTGKGVLAAWLHGNGPRRHEPFVDLNCAGLSRDLLASELFGYDKGAFTGAASSKAGLLEVAHCGTVFLDEIGDMDPEVQPKLLKVVEEKRFRRLGDVKDRRVDVRLISATHQDLAAMVSTNRFRADLYYRVSTIPLRVPPLRERSEDVPALAAWILDGAAAELKRPPARLSEDAVAALKSYYWPGNIRELRNVLERAALLSPSAVLTARDLRFAGSSARAQEDISLTLEEMERRHIERVLVAEGGQVDAAAQRLGVPRSSLYKMLARYRAGGLPS